ncbi:restriction endonuclease subunit S [Actinosynnema sp. NPDC051121]
MTTLVYDETSETELPTGWTTGVLGDYVERPDYGFTDSASDDSSGTKFLRITDIQDGQVDWPSVPYCNCPPDVLRSKRLRPGDVVVARIGATTGKSFYIDATPDDAVFASYLIRLRAKPEKILPRYLYFYMQTDEYWAHIDLHKGDRLKGGVNIAVLESMPVAVPPIDKQAQIVQVLDLLQAAVRLHLRQGNAFQSLLDTLLRSLLSGATAVDEFDLSVLPTPTIERAAEDGGE